MVIAIAPTVEERARIADALDGTSLVLLVSKPSEAVEFLRGASAEPVPPGPEQPGRPEQVRRPGQVAGPAQHSVGLDVDSDRRVVRWNGRERGLTPLEHGLLVCLLDRVGHIRTFESIQRRVWGNDHLGDRSHVQSVVKRLRRKLGELDSPARIEAVRGVGLRLVDVPDVEGAPGRVQRVPAPRTSA